MINRLTLLALICISSPCLADELLFNSFTHHGSKNFTYQCGSSTCSRPYNNVNPGIHYRFDNGVSIGTYKNSYYRQSVALGYKMSYNDNVGLVLAYATGYEDKPNRGLLGGLDIQTNEFKGWRLGILGCPIQTKSIDSIFTLYVSKHL